MEYGKAQRPVSRREIKKGGRRRRSVFDKQGAEKKKIAFKFSNALDLARCLEFLIEKRPDAFYDLPGRNSMILYEDEVDWLKGLLVDKKISLLQIPVVSASDLDPGRIGELRARRGQRLIKDHADPEWKKKRIQQLKEELGV